MKINFLVVLCFLTGTLGQQKPSAPADTSEMQHQHGGFMQGGMHHTVMSGVKLDERVDTSSHTITLRVGPMALPARTGHMKMPQPADLTWKIGVNGWLLAYRPQLVDASGNQVPGTVLHHVAFWNEDRPDFLCPNKEEHIFGAGSEMTNWRAVPGFGYRVEKGDRIRIETMVHNPTERAYQAVYLEIAIPYAETGAGTAFKNVYPAWMDVKSCGNSSYDLKPGKSTETGTVRVPYDGALLGVGGHMHDYGRQLVLEDATRKDTVAKLDMQVDEEGHLLSVPVKTFFDQGGYKFSAGDELKISASYDNTSGKLLGDGAMGIVVGYFVPANDGKVAALRRKPQPRQAAASHQH
jgi:hypothetical protein